MEAPLSSTVATSVPMAETLLLTIETDPDNANAAAMRASAEACGWLVLVVGGGATWRGVSTKFELLARTLAELSPATLVLVADARDVMVLRGPDEFAAAFAAYKAPLVVSMEMFAEGSMVFQPQHAYRQVADLAPYWAAIGTPQPPVGARRYVNSGLVAGSAAAQLDLWRFGQHLHTDDQMALGDYMNAFPDRVAADAGAALLHTCGAGVYGGSDCATQLADAPTLLELSGRGAFALHVPGIQPSASPGQRQLYTWIQRMDPPRMRREMLALYPHGTDWREWAIARGAIPGALRPCPLK